jgi:hypothetical protein
VFSVIIELSPLPLHKFALMLSLISKLMVTCLDGRMVNTQRAKWGRELPRERESASTVKFGSSDRLDP